MKLAGDGLLMHQRPLLLCQTITSEFHLHILRLHIGLKSSILFATYTFNPQLQRITALFPSHWG